MVFLVIYVVINEENMSKIWEKWGKYEEKYDKIIFQECNPECSDFQQECQKEGNV